MNIFSPLLKRKDEKLLLWFEYNNKKTNILCIFTFLLALMNLVLQIMWLMDYFNVRIERFQAPGFNYGDVELCNSIMILLLCMIIIGGANNYFKYMKVAKYFITISQCAQVLLELLFCSTGVFQVTYPFFVFQPVPFLVVQLLNNMGKISFRIVFSFCVLDYILFLIKEYILCITDSIGFYIVFEPMEGSVIKLFVCILFILILLTFDSLYHNNVNRNIHHHS